MLMQVIYVDSLFFLNLCIDYLLCLVSARVCGLVLKRLRYLLAALIGACYSVAVLLPGLDFLAEPLCKLAGWGWLEYSKAIKRNDRATTRPTRNPSPRLLSRLALSVFFTSTVNTLNGLLFRYPSVNDAKLQY